MHAELERELKQLIVASLMLEDVAPEEIESETALFGTGLSLDSIDALELAIALERRFGVKIQPNDEEAPKIFASVRSLAAHVAGQLPSSGPSIPGQSAPERE
jgi:acyl carrier protein